MGKNFYGANEQQCILAVGAVLGLAVLTVIWFNQFLPMQDYPQHLFMAWVANSYADPSLGLADTYQLRSQFGPYRATYLAQRALGSITDIQTAGKIVASLYVFLVGYLAYRVQQDSTKGNPAWGVLLLFPACLHPMYFYGFFNFTFSIPVLFLALLNLRALLTANPTWRDAVHHLVLLVCLFLLHPYTLLVYIVFSLITIPVLARSRRQLSWALFSTFSGLTLFVGWMGYSSFLAGAEAQFSIMDIKLKWWPVELTGSFLAMMFTGMRFTQDPNWWVACLWGGALLLGLIGYWRYRRQVNYWLPILFLIALVGYFVLPFSVQTDARFTFFNTRMAPILLFLLVIIIAQVPLGKYPGYGLLGIAVLLTGFSVHLHSKVAQEFDQIVPIMEKLSAKPRILPLIVNSRSDYLDPTFFAQFHYHSMFYYHLTHGGGVNPDLFANKLMPVAFREGMRPPRPPIRELHQWGYDAAQYDYILARQVPAVVRRQLDQYLILLEASGPWRLYQIPERMRRANITRQ